MGSTLANVQATSPKSKATLGLALLIAFPSMIFLVWYAHVHWTVVNKPVSLTPGAVKVEFAPNFTGHYVAGIRVQRTLPFETLQCLLGEKDYIPAGQCKEIPPALQFDWQLLTDGNVVAKGTSNRSIGGSYAAGYIEMEFLNFQARSGQKFSLELDFTKDGGKLAPTKPHLMVMVDPMDSFDIAMLLPWLLLLGVVCAAVRLTLFSSAKKILTEATPAPLQGAFHLLELTQGWRPGLAVPSPLHGGVIRSDG
jgi:hypothetical protein